MACERVKLAVIINYRANGKARQVALGRFGDHDGGWSVSAARKKATEIRDAARHENVDYVEEVRKENRKQISKDELTLQKALDEMIADRTDLRQRSILSYRNPIQRYLCDWLQRPLYQISGQDVVTRFAEIESGKNLNTRKDGGKFAAKSPDGKRQRKLNGGPASAKSTMTALRAVWQYAAWRHQDSFSLPKSPTSRLPKGWNAVRVRARVLPNDKFAEFVRACEAYGDESQGDLAKFLLFSGLRRTEAERLIWGEINLSDGIIEIGEERMKGKREFKAPLTGLAMEVLQNRYNEDCQDNDFVFLSGRGSRLRPREQSHTKITGKFLRYLSKHVGEHTSPHDWRRSFSTLALGVGIPLQIVDSLTAHKPQGSVTLQHYYAPSLQDLRKGTRKIDHALRELIAPTEKVVRLRS